MFRPRLKSKIHRVAVTHCELHCAQLVFVDEANRPAGTCRFVPTQPF